jgi:CheY-like chemotaxis protein
MIDLLIIDDEEVLRTLLCRWGTSGGYRVTEAGNLAEALARIDERVPDVVLCDLSLPDGDGRELAARLRQWCSQTAVVLMSGGSHTDGASCVAAGAISYLTKPFTRDQLMTALAHAIDCRLERQFAAVWARTGPRLSAPS